MMSGIQHGSWDGAVFLGYHSGAGTSGSPMAHTMEPQKVDYIEINGERASEFTLNAYMAGLHGVPCALFPATRPCAKPRAAWCRALPRCLW